MNEIKYNSLDSVLTSILYLSITPWFIALAGVILFNPFVTLKNKAIVTKADYAEAVYGNLIMMIVLNTLNIFNKIFGGYLSAKLSNQNKLINCFITGIIIFVIEIINMFWITGNSEKTYILSFMPEWMIIFTYFGTIPFILFGGLLEVKISNWSYVCKNINHSISINRLVFISILIILIQFTYYAIESTIFKFILNLLFLIITVFIVINSFILTNKPKDAGATSS